MKALSIKQPWAWLICRGYKDIENRDWPTNFRGRIYVHAGKHFDESADQDWIEHNVNNGDIPDFVLINNGKPKIIVPDNRYLKALCEPLLSGAKNTAVTLGAIIGEVDITGCVTESPSPWFVGPYGFTLVNPVLYATPIPCRGMLGFFEPDLIVK